MQPEIAHIAARASQLWQLNGSPHGRDIEFWLQAESELRKEIADTREKAAATPSPQPAAARKTKPARP